MTLSSNSYAPRPSALAGNSTATWSPSDGANPGHATGWTFTSSGTISHPALATTNLKAQIRRTAFLSSTTANAAAGLIGAQAVCWLGSAADLGGFRFSARFGLDAAVPSSRAFIGLSERSASMVSANPSSFDDSIGVGFDTSDSTWQLIIKRAGSPAVKVDTGEAFNATDLYDLTIAAMPNGARVSVVLTNLTTRETLLREEYTVAADLPQSSVFLVPHAEVGCATTTTATELDLAGMVLETPDGARVPAGPLGAQGVYNVRDFGAIGDGVADDLPAFNAAMAAARLAPGLGQTIYVPAGIYLLSDTLHITDCLRLCGPGGTTKTSVGGARLRFPAGKLGVFIHSFASSSVFAGRTGGAVGTEIDHLFLEAPQLSAGALPLWQPSHSYSPGDTVRCLNDNRFVYVCVVGGTSGTVQPMHDDEFDTIGGTNTGKAWDATFDDPNDGSGTLEWRAEARAGILSLVECSLHHLYITGFLNAGVHLNASLTAPLYFSSTSNSQLERVHVAQCGVGIYLFGGDAGNCVIANCFSESCGVAGPWVTQERLITSASNASPIVITVNSKHQLKSGDRVFVSGVGGNTAANSATGPDVPWYVTVTSDTAFSLWQNEARTTPVAGSGSYTGGGTASSRSTGGYGFLDSSQYGSLWDTTNAIGNTGCAYYRPDIALGTSVWLHPYTEGDQPNPIFNGLVLGGVWGVDHPTTSVHPGYDALAGYWNQLWVKDFHGPAQASIRMDDFRHVGADSFFGHYTNHDGDAVLAERYESSGDHKGWWVHGVRSAYFNRPLRGYSGQQAAFGTGHARTFWGEFRGKGLAPYFIGLDAGAKTDTFLRQEQGIGGHYLPGDRFEPTTDGSGAVGQVCTEEGWDAPSSWVTPLNPGPFYLSLNHGIPTHTIQEGGFVYAVTKFGAVGGSAPAFPTTFLTDASHLKGGIVPYRWSASRKWRIGDFCSPESARNGHYYKVTAVTGADGEGYVTGAGSTPSFPTGSGATVVENGPTGTITWTEQGSDVGTYVADGTTEWQCVGPRAVFEPYAFAEHRDHAPTPQIEQRWADPSTSLGLVAPSASLSRMRREARTTTGASSQVLATVPVPADSAISLEALLLGNVKGSNDGCSIRLAGTYKRNGSGSALEIAEASPIVQRSAGLNAALTGDLNPSGAGVQIRVSPVDPDTIDWAIVHESVQVSGDPFVPTDLDGLLLWLRADQGITLNGSDVSAWTDHSGTGDANKNLAQATSGLQPLFNTSSASYNGHPTVSFSGSDALVSGTWAASLPQPFTVFVVGNLTTSATKYLFDSINTTFQTAIYDDATTLAAYASGFVYAGASTLNTPAVCRVLFNHANTEVSMNRRSPDARGLTSPSAVLTGTTVGNYAGGSSFAGSEIAEVLVVAGRPSDIEMARLMAYFANRYNLVIAP